eukprot:TRINITY_DN112420_c0_g1_i1.p1 TRINITY_DN112420_c0_g1~~TRINITY_DN112420_c0_g1_i1.p1  ORF type:complete len:439 (-),score=65.36 TRINITY_DN112420_c0_g1_i1:94-1380(-)
MLGRVFSRTCRKLCSNAAEITALRKQVSDLEAENARLKKGQQTGPIFNEEGKFISVETVLNGLPETSRKEVMRILYGQEVATLDVSQKAQELSGKHNFEIGAYSFPNANAESPRRVRIGAIQQGIPAPTHLSVSEQKDAFFKMMSPMVQAAGEAGVNVLCLQEAWCMPFFFCTRERKPWLEFAELPNEEGASTQMLAELAKRYNMVIINPILERDPRKGTLHNTAVVINKNGKVMGKHRKNHIPRVGDFNESTYYMEGNTGHPVFETAYGKIAINICYGRHHPLNWLGFALNGADIIFNPSATVDGLSEHLWCIEARNAAIANSCYTVGINRTGTETYPNEFTSGDGKPAHKDFGHFYGTSYVTAPNGTRSPGLRRVGDGLLVTEVDLNLITQVRDTWGFTMTGRHEEYADLLKKYSQHNFEPQVITE